MPFKAVFEQEWAPFGVEADVYMKLAHDGVLYWRFRSAIVMPGNYQVPSHFRRITRCSWKQVQEAIRETSEYVTAGMLSQEAGDSILLLLFQEQQRRLKL